MFNQKFQLKKNDYNQKQPLKILHSRVYLYTTAKYLIISRCTSRCCALFHSLFILLIDASGQFATTKNKTFTIISHQLESYKVSRNDLKNIFIYISIERLFFEYSRAMCVSVRAYGAHSFIYLHFICILCLQAFRYSISALDFWLKKL